MLSDRLGIQSWCFREFKETDKLIEALKKCTVDRIELCGVHIDVNSPAKTLQDFKAAGITVSSFGIHGFSADEAAARKVFELAVAAGFQTIGCSFALKEIPMLEKLCKEYGKKLAIHNHGRHDHLGSPWRLEEVFAQTSENIGLCMDTAWMLDAGCNPVEMAEKFQKRLYGVHVKDFIFDRAGKPEDVVVGEGNLDLKGFFAFLNRIKYSGYLTLEYEADASNPVPALKKCVDAIRSVDKATA